MLKWKLMITTVPYVLVVLALKALLDYVFEFHGIIDFSDISWILTGGIFLLGFMLAGTLTDYKESEKLPAEIACCLETLEESFAQAANNRNTLNLPDMRQSILKTTDSICDWLYKKIDAPAMFKALENLNLTIGEIERAEATSYSTRSLNELNALRKALSRLNVISRTGFLSSGYAILEVLIGIVVAVLMIASFKSRLSEVILVTFVPLVYIYLLRLIRDIDDPFEYSETKKNADEVPLFPLEEYRERLMKRCG